MALEKLLNLVLKLYYNLLQKYFLSFFSDFLPAATQAKTVTTSTLANLAANSDRNCSIEPILRISSGTQAVLGTVTHPNSNRAQ